MKATVLFALMLMTAFPAWAEKSSVDTEDKVLSIFMHEVLVVHPMLLFYDPEDPYKINKEDLSFKYQAVSLKNMVQTIKENELAAEIEYEQPFMVSSSIDKITRSMGKPVLRLENKGESVLDNTVSAFFEESAVSDLATLKKGKSVTIACNGWSYSMSVQLKDCKLMRTVFDEYRHSIDPKSIAQKACKKNPTKTTVLLSRLSKAIGEVDPSIRQDFFDQTLASDGFKYRGLSGDLLDSNSFGAISEVMEKNLKDLKDKKEGDFTKEDC